MFAFEISSGFTSLILPPHQRPDHWTRAATWSWTRALAVTTTSAGTTTSRPTPAPSSGTAAAAAAGTASRRRRSAGAPVWRSDDQQVRERQETNKLTLETFWFWSLFLLPPRRLNEHSSSQSDVHCWGQVDVQPSQTIWPVCFLQGCFCSSLRLLCHISIILKLRQSLPG